MACISAQLVRLLWVRRSTNPRLFFQAKLVGNSQPADNRVAPTVATRRLPKGIRNP